MRMNSLNHGRLDEALGTSTGIRRAKPDTFLSVNLPWDLPRTFPHIFCVGQAPLFADWLLSNPRLHLRSSHYDRLQPDNCGRHFNIGVADRTFKNLTTLDHNFSTASRATRLDLETTNASVTGSDHRSEPPVFNQRSQSPHCPPPLITMAAPASGIDCQPPPMIVQSDKKSRTTSCLLQYQDRRQRRRQNCV